MRTLTVTLLAALVASSLAATCETVDGNLLASLNCGFDKDVKGWVPLLAASVARDASENGVLKATGDRAGSLTIIGPCAPVQAGAGYQVTARLRVAAGNAYFCAVNAFQYSDAQCSAGQQPLASAAGPPEATWKAVEGSAKTDSAAKAVHLHAVCSGEPGFVVMFDDFVLRRK